MLYEWATVQIATRFPHKISNIQIEIKLNKGMNTKINNKKDIKYSKKRIVYKIYHKLK